MLKGSLKSILVIFFQRKDACDLTASTNHGMPDGNEDKLINDGAVAVVNCCCKRVLMQMELLMKQFFMLAG